MFVAKAEAAKAAALQQTSSARRFQKISYPIERNFNDIINNSKTLNSAMNYFEVIKT